MEPQLPFAAGKKIIIIGGGVAGLAFAISLRKQWPDGSAFPEIVVYERDNKELSIGREGYSISIRGDARSGGLQALEKMGLSDTATQQAVSQSGVDGSGGFMMWDLQWNTLLGLGNQPGIRITRDTLRRVMIDAALSIPEVHIRWGTACSDVKLEDGIVTVVLPDGNVDQADILIAADGASSKIRVSVRPDDKLSFAGAVLISGSSNFPSGQVPAPVDRNWGLVLGGGGTGFFTSPVAASRALWSVSYLSNEPREKMKTPYSQEQVETLLEEALDRGRSFAEPFQSMVKNSDPATVKVINAMDKPPFSHADPQSPIIFIGDANHPVSPFAGNGANMALMDGWELATQFSKAKSLPEALTAYDKSSVSRSQAALSQSHWSISMAHATGVKLFLYRTSLKLIGILTWLRG
ncbi:hypothetical protein AJ80_08882 [Polytolypa hystricis UAMH7299]|uniref:FAD-binding domain-containing protein n=1 Tax=Polytolypa hystricis (strain UAMH7299) TaxID=1447883 RepID=A0A2B7X0B6_POLH7|nr:hypothetical protein AJ80_08882 [Polytolypa hystricis UAMH7299]